MLAVTAQKLQGIVHEYYFDAKTKTLAKTDFQRILTDVPAGILTTQENVLCMSGKNVQILGDQTSNTAGKRIFKSRHAFEPLSIEHNNFSRFARDSGDPLVDQLIHDLRQHQIEPTYGIEKMASDIVIVPDPSAERTHFETSL